ncbi:recombination-associated protein RdgC [Duganella sp. HSC-15S17]|uniref:Recombination-associated protein RdgC n=2 Tax=Duganella violaceipulchra TaxID=2849652 RepID=A0AA41L881_9BURK|nr:recombination-associated protein RdgC [Duganella violaceicalia]MCP2007034.1 recombination associated protein RdgC [Duganella violaceicalia]
MFKNLQMYRLPGFLTSAESLNRMLAQQAFAPAGSNELLREGWEPPRPAGELVHVINGQFLLKLTTESKVLPAAVINQVTKARAAEMEEAQGFAPGKKAMKELRERVADELLPRAFPKRDSTWVWIDPVNGWLVVGAASPAKADQVIRLLLKAVDKFPVESLRVQRSPVGVMTEWLQADDAPAGFTVDMDATLQATGESKAQVQWKRHTLEADELRRHIAAGKQCIRLAMTWDSKISFVLDQSLAVKSVKLLDVLTEKNYAKDDAERFDGDFALVSGELAKLLADLVEALGGVAEGEPPVTRPAAGDEPVQPQRAVMRLGGIPDGDGSATDPLYPAAVALVREQDRASISLVQRVLRITYNRASSLLQAMEAADVVGSTQGVYVVANVAGVAA